MAAVSDAYTQYIDKREKILDAVSTHDRRIARFFLIDRCIEGLKVLSGVSVLWAIARSDNTVAIFGALGMVCMGVVSIVVGMRQAVNGESERKRQTEQRLQILDEAWRQWTMPRRGNGSPRAPQETDA